MEAKHTPGPCPVTPTRLRWLQHLAKHGESRWERMPKRENGLGAVTNATWRPMVAAGLITARYGQRHFSEPTDWLFTITDAGRAAIAKATGSTT
jgi:hypothetical protein